MRNRMQITNQETNSVNLSIYIETRKRCDATNKQTLALHETNTSRSLAGNTWATNDCTDCRAFHVGGLVSGDLPSPALLVGVG